MVTIMAAAAVWVCWAAERGTATRVAQQGDIAMQVELVPADGIISAGEPVIARVIFTNQSQEILSLRFPGVAGCTRLAIADSRCEIVLATPKPQPERYLDMVFSGPTLGPGESDEKMLVVTAWYQFTEPGEYTVRVQQLEFKEGTPVLWESSAPLRVLPLDPTRLEARCEELFQGIRKHERGDLDLGMRALALYSVRHELILPYLDWMAREWENWNTCLAIRRVGTERAEKLIQALASRRDQVGKAARIALEKPLEPRIQEVCR